MTLQLRARHSGSRKLTRASSVVQTGVKSAGWENKMTQEFSQKSANFNVSLSPVSRKQEASKSGATSPKRNILLQGYGR